MRNRLRNEVFPLLAEISGRDAVPAFVRGAADTADAGGAGSMGAGAGEGARSARPAASSGAADACRWPCSGSRLRKFLQDHGIASLDRDLIERGLGLMDVTNPAVVNLPGRRQAAAPGGALVDRALGVCRRRAR